MKKRKILSAIDLPCSVCGAKADERCKQDPHPSALPWHVERVWDANDAQTAVEALTQ